MSRPRNLDQCTADYALVLNYVVGCRDIAASFGNVPVSIYIRVCDEQLVQTHLEEERERQNISFQ